jgi:hypothetical protein
MPSLNAVFNIVVVDINMFSTLIVTLSVHKVNRRLVVAIQLNRLSILAKVSKLSKYAIELGCFLSSIDKSNVLGFSS